MQRERRSRTPRSGSASVGASIAIVVALAAAVGIAVALRGNRAQVAGAPAAGAEAPDRAPAPLDAADAEAPSAAPAASQGPSAPEAPAPSARIPRLVDLGAGKCIPCKLMAPILDALKEDFAGRLDVVFIDVWEKPEEASKYGIKLIPTQIFYDASGKELFRHEGFYSREDILGKWKELGVDLFVKTPNRPGP